MTDSNKNPKPIAPASTAPSAAAATAVNASAAPSANTKRVTRKGAQAGNPTVMANPARAAVKNDAGARYGIKVKMDGGIAPEAGATLGNGRLFSSAINRTKPNFSAGVDASY